MPLAPISTDDTRPRTSAAPSGPVVVAAGDRQRAEGYAAAVSAVDGLGPTCAVVAGAALPEVLRGGACTVLVVDDSLPEVLAVVRWALAAELAVVVVTAQVDLAAAGLALGATAWAQPAPAAVATVVATLLIEHGGVDPAAPVSRPDLTPREHEILLRLSTGVSNAAIAAELFVSEETVRSHVKRLLRRMGARNRTHAATLAYRAGWVR